VAGVLTVMLVLMLAGVILVLMAVTLVALTLVVAPVTLVTLDPVGDGTSEEDPITYDELAGLF